MAFSQIDRSYMFGASFFWTMAMLHYLSFPWMALPSPALHTGAIQGKEGIKFCHMATLIIGGRVGHGRGRARMTDRVIDFILTSPPHLCSGASSLASRRIISASAMTGVSRPAAIVGLIRLPARSPPVRSTLLATG